MTTRSIHFETPENVQVQYEPAGPGTRFVAWFLDQIILTMAAIAIIVLLIVAGASFGFLIDESFGRPANSDRIIFYIAGGGLLVWSLSGFIYFGASELLMRGQTLGKRLLDIRVVKLGGFQLDATSILVRNIFRVVDNLPPMWIIPVVSRLGQRAGDMVSGTIVVNDAPAKLSVVRTALAGRSPAEASYRFDNAKLQRLTSGDFETIERLLDRWADLPTDQQASLLSMVTHRIAQKLGTDPPPADQELRFLEDLLAAELRRQERNLV